MNSAPSSTGARHTGSESVNMRPPIRLRASNIDTASPACPSSIAAASPAAPAPMITMSGGTDMSKENPADEQITELDADHGSFAADKMDSHLCPVMKRCWMPQSALFLQATGNRPVVIQRP